VGTALWGLLTLIALAVTLVLLSVAFTYTRRLERQPTLPVSEEIGAAPRVVRKLRKREPMTPEEFEYAKRIVAIRGHPMAFCIPFTLFALSSYYVLGSLEHLHGARPSERTFIGVIPMLTSTNLAIQVLRARRLKGRLREAPMAA
jgi:Flp pilus assembly protein TadB